MSEIVVVVTDPLDGGAVDRWAGELAAAVHHRPDRLVADLTDCAWIDAAAIGVLLRTHGQMIRANGTFVLRRPPARVRRTLRLARVDQVLEVEEPAVLTGVLPVTEPGVLADVR
jgi:anti-anti-sigma factor